MAEVHFETVFFSGRVQGVGFRYQTLQIAKEFEVTGLVKNLLDGRVQLEVEGSSEEVDAFISSIEERLYGYIRKTERHSRTRQAEYQGFAIG